MTKRDRLMILTVLAVALLGGFWMLVFKPQQQATADARAQVEQANSALDAARSRVDSGRRAQDAFRRDRTTIVKLGRVVPETDDIPTLITQLESLARRERVLFVSYDLQSDASTGATSGSAASTDSSAATSATTPSNDDGKGSSSTQAVAPLFPPGSVEIAGGLGRTPVQVEFRGTYFSLERYLRAVQRFAVISQKSARSTGRLMIVDGFSYERAEGKTELIKKLQTWARQPVLNATLSASVYFAPPLDAPSAGSAGGSGAATPGTGSATPASGTTTGTAVIGGVK